ncbi:hypothetical protein [Nonomuraea rosea]|uniref:hypothetical protein n=1 Tax=Nonomuraea rosea TaxID=638574 RepID=UPI0031F0B3AD
MVTASLVVSAGTAEACQCLRSSPQRHMKRADAVFTATVMRVRPLERKVTATLRVDHVYKGGAGAMIDVSTRAEGPACGYEFVEGMRYLVFGAQEAEGLATSSCSGNTSIPAGELPLRLSDVRDDMALASELISALGEATRVQAAEPVIALVSAVARARLAALRVQLEQQ